MKWINISGPPKYFDLLSVFACKNDWILSKGVEELGYFLLRGEEGICKGYNRNWLQPFQACEFVAHSLSWFQSKWLHQAWMTQPPYFSQLGSLKWSFNSSSLTPCQRPSLHIPYPSPAWTPWPQWEKKMHARMWEDSCWSPSCNAKASHMLEGEHCSWKIGIGSDCNWKEERWLTLVHCVTQN